jgi:hypothetical protein
MAINNLKVFEKLQDIHWPPNTIYIRPTVFDIENINLFFTKQATFMRRSNSIRLSLMFRMACTKNILMIVNDHH